MNNNMKNNILIIGAHFPHWSMEARRGFYNYSTLNGRYHTKDIFDNYYFKRCSHVDSRLFAERCVFFDTVHRTDEESQNNLEDYKILNLDYNHLRAIVRIIPSQSNKYNKYRIKESGTIEIITNKLFDNLFLLLDNLLLQQPAPETNILSEFQPQIKPFQYDIGKL